MIAHRLVTVRHTDRMIVLHAGRTVEEGSHEALMTRRGHYAELYDTYFHHQAPDYAPWRGDAAADMTNPRRSRTDAIALRRPTR